MYPTASCSHVAELNFAAGFFFTGAGEGVTTGDSGGRNGDAIVGFRSGGLGWEGGELGVGLDEVEAGLAVCSFASRLRRIY